MTPTPSDDELAELKRRWLKAVERDPTPRVLPPLWQEKGYTSREEWLEDRRATVLARLTTRQRLARWWSWNSAAVVLSAFLVLAVAVALVIWGLA